MNGKKIEPVNFFDLKRILNRLFHSTGINLPNQPWTLLENLSSWQYGHATSLGNVHQNKIQISAGIINLELSKGKEIKGPVLAAEILIDPVFSGKEKAFCLSSILLFSTRDQRFVSSGR